MRRLIVALDAVAALRDACGREAPGLLRTAVLAEGAGADAIRVGVNEAMRPVRESELHDLRRVVGCLELRMAPSPSLLKLALEVRPDRVVLAAEPRMHRFDAPPLDPDSLRAGVPAALRALGEAGIPARVRIAPDAESVKAVRAAGCDAVEFSTISTVDLPEHEREAAWDRFGETSRLAAKLRMATGAAGALETTSIRELLEAAPVVDRVAAGREWAARALLVGVERAVGELRAVLV